jgi:hypothetical protein
MGEEAAIAEALDRQGSHGASAKEGSRAKSGRTSKDGKEKRTAPSGVGKQPTAGKSSGKGKSLGKTGAGGVGVIGPILELKKPFIMEKLKSLLDGNGMYFYEDKLKMLMKYYTDYYAS